MIELTLKAGRERSVLRRHPWILSGAVAAVEGAEGQEPGGAVRVSSATGKVLGYGHYSPASQIRVRLLSFGAAAPGEGELAARVAAAVARRAGCPLLGETNALRLVNAEGDGLPGLIADRYGDVVVVKLGSAGMQRRRDEIAEALREATGAAAGFERADAAAARREGLPAHQGPLWGEAPAAPVAIRERDREFEVDVVEGQKTGFYLDQRDARDRVAQLAAGRRVLDLFSFTGGFAVAAARGGAEQVTLVESSSSALARAELHMKRNAPAASFECHGEDAFEFARKSERGVYDLIIADPPPMARRRGDVQKASRAYKDLFLHAIGLAAPGARLLFFACSHHVDADLLRKIVFGASVDARRSLRVLGTLGAPVDHPVSLDHPEGEYLRGLLLEL
ncbi:MAG: class I SAM-dependent rRNA methyltransferase [Deltaproteobacteria bacterium]|nr:class I SAM-dependent rRNA methyltransferase [Deltaproteobacteria bacterium]